MAEKLLSLQRNYGFFDKMTGGI